MHITIICCNNTNPWHTDIHNQSYKLGIGELTTWVAFKNNQLWLILYSLDGTLLFRRLRCFETIEINHNLVSWNFVNTCIRMTWWGCTWQKESKTCQHHCIISRFANPCHSLPNRWYIYPVVSGEGDWHAERSSASNWLLLCNWTAGTSLYWKVIKLNCLFIFLSFAISSNHLSD